MLDPCSRLRHLSGSLSRIQDLILVKQAGWNIYWAKLSKQSWIAKSYLLDSEFKLGLTFEICEPKPSHGWLSCLTGATISEEPFT